MELDLIDQDAMDSKIVHDILTEADGYTDMETSAFGYERDECVIEAGFYIAILRHIDRKTFVPWNA